MDRPCSQLLHQLHQVIMAYTQKQLPNVILSNLEINVQDLIRLIANNEFLPQASIFEKTTYINQLAHFLENFRQYIQKRFGIWAMINQPMMDQWVQQFPQQRYLEIMAGNASLSAALAQRDQKVIATDNGSWAAWSQTSRNCWFPVQKLDARQAVQKYGAESDVILLAWSPDGDPIDWQILQLIRQLPNQPQFWIIGEYQGATNSTLFWQRAHFKYDQRIHNINQYYPHFDLVKDRLLMVR